MVAEMTRAFRGLLLTLCCTTAWGQYPIYPAYPQPPGLSVYPQYQSFYRPQFYSGISPYGYGSYGFGARGYYPPNPFGNMNWLPPNPPSPYYVTPSGKQYLEQTRRRERAIYSELMLWPSLQQ
jgi:hypothetical protein